jgi:hypothetical protein
LERAWDTRSIYNVAFVGPLFKLASVGKGLTAGLKLAWSFAHAKHVVIKMSLTNTLTAMQRTLLTPGSRFRPELWQKHMESAFKLSIQHGREVKLLRGEKLDSPATAEELENVEHFKQMGLNAGVNEERQMQFIQNIASWFPKLHTGARWADETLAWGYKAISSEFYQKYLFGEIIPRVKFTAAMQVRDGLLLAHPELANPGNEMAFRMALRKGGEAIDARFGEMNYANLYWNKMAKDIGQATLLSMGWQIGFLRVYGGAVKDLGSNAAHMGELVKKIKGQESEHTFLSDRILFAANYTALNMLEAGVMTYFAMKMSGAKDEDAWPKGWDYAYPRTGKGPDGKDRRVQPIEYSREWYSWRQHIKKEGGYGQGGPQGTADFWANKEQPFLQSLVEDWQNKNYFGQQIHDPNDSDGKQIWDRLSEAASNLLLPIPFAQGVQNTGDNAGKSLTEKIFSPDTGMAMLGYPKAPAWTTKTDTENMIADEYHRTHQQVSSPAQIQVKDADSALRQAILKKDDKARAEAVQKLHSLGVKDATIQGIVKKAHVSYEEYMFSRLAWDTQVKQLKKMPPEEVAKYLKHASQHAKEEFKKESMPAIR